MKKVLALSFLCVLSQQAYGLTDQEVLRGVIGSHNRALDNANMYAKPLNDQNLADWELAMFEVKIFVGLNSQANRKYLLDRFNDIKRANDNLIDSIKKAYTAQRNNNGLNEASRLMFQADLAKALEEAKLVQKGLDWIQASSDSEAKAIKLLGTLAACVKTTAGKAIKDLGFTNPNVRRQTEWIPAK